MGRGYPTTQTIIPIVEQFADRHGLSDMVVVADAGMLSASNLKEFDKAGLRFIVGSRAVKAPLDLASHFRWHGDAFTDAQLIDTITAKNRKVIENDPMLRAEPVWDPEQHQRRGERCGPTRPNELSGTARPSRCRRTAPRRSSPGRRPHGHHGS